VAVSYTQTLSTDMIVSEIETLLDWRVTILRQCFFPGSQQRPAEAHAPSALLMWCKREAERNAIDNKIADHLAAVHEDLCGAARNMLNHCASGAQPTLELYDALENRFEAFITQIRRLQADVSDSVVAVDPVTGLRTVAGMRNDIKREQDRFDRKGTSFSIASVEIDNLAEIQGKYDRRSQDVVYANVAHLIARTVRSFDDAYYLGKGEYLIVLKHVEFMDACSVMDRLRNEIENTPILMPNGEKMRLTSSFGIAEAMQRESADLSVENAKSALRAAREEGGNRVKEFRERSALENYARDLGKKA
jgi:diguanylate cyclase (GGDEF)-like protein